MTHPMLASAYRRFRPYFHNTAWIVAEKLLAMTLAFVVTVFVARYLGPGNFGILAYATSLAALFGIAGHMGLQGLVVRELVKKPALRAETLGTAAVLKFIGVLVGYVALLGYAAVYEGADSKAFKLIAIAGAALLFMPLNVIDHWFNALVQARYVSVARVAGALLFAGGMLWLVVAGAGIVPFAVPYVLQALVAAVALLLLFRAKSGMRLADWRFDAGHARELLSQGWVIYLASFFSVVYLKIDQVMLRWLSDPSEVGVYAVAARLSEALYFIPIAIVASVFPRLIALREESERRFTQRLQQLFDGLVALGMLIALLVTLLAPWLVPLIFGADYVASTPILVIHTWASVFIFMRAALSRWILIENALYFSMLNQGLGALSNIGLNYMLIPFYGGKGAAWATLVSYAIASFFAVAIYRRTRPVFWLMLKSLLAPLRYPLNYFLSR
jgi:O-antigen/teichoic acid export membrane protein